MPLYPLLRVDTVRGLYFINPEEIVAIISPSNEDVALDSRCRSIVIFDGFPDFRSTDSPEDLAGRYAECIRLPIVELAERVAAPRPTPDQLRLGPIIATIERPIQNCPGGYHAVIP